MRLNPAGALVSSSPGPHALVLVHIHIQRFGTSETEDFVDYYVFAGATIDESVALYRTATGAC